MYKQMLVHLDNGIIFNIYKKKKKELPSMKRHEEIKCIFLSDKANPKRICTIWFQIYDTQEKTKLWGKQDEWLLVV